MTPRAFRLLARRMVRLLAHPLCRVTTSGMLFLSGIFELFDTPLERSLGFAIRLAHGVLFYAALQLIKDLAELAAGWQAWHEPDQTGEKG